MDWSRDECRRSANFGGGDIGPRVSSQRSRGIVGRRSIFCRLLGGAEVCSFLVGVIAFCGRFFDRRCVVDGASWVPLVSGEDGGVELAPAVERRVETPRTGVKSGLDRTSTAGCAFRTRAGGLPLCCFIRYFCKWDATCARVSRGSFMCFKILLGTAAKWERGGGRDWN